MASIYSHSKLFKRRSFLNGEAFTHREAFTHTKLLDTKSFTQNLLHTASFCRKETFTQRSFLVHNHDRNCSSKTGSRRQSEKNTTLKHFLKGILIRKLLAPKLRKSADKSLSQPWCNHSNTIYEIQLQKTVLRMEARHEATLTQPLQCDLQNTIELRATASEIAASKPDLDAKATKRRFWSTFQKEF